MKDVSVDWSIRLKINLKNRMGRCSMEWTGFTWLRTGKKMKMVTNLRVSKIAWNFLELMWVLEALLLNRKQ